ncbi:MAG: haloalkane dehalogenase [Pseudomonadota bacterium]
MPIDALRTPEDRFAAVRGWDYSPNYIEDLPGYEGLRLAYIDEGPRSGPVFLCLHGQPTWSFLYRKMAAVFLQAGYRVVAPDLFGFGRSDKPVDEDVYTFDFHRGALLALVAYLDLQDVCLVCQDWGGILGLTLPMAAPARYKQLLVMNTALPDGGTPSPGFAAWRAYNRQTHDLDIGAMMKRGTPVLSDEEAEAYNAPFPDARYKAGVRSFPELAMFKEDDKPLNALSGAGLETSLKARAFWTNDWQGPSFMAIGMTDPVLGPPVMADVRSCIANCPAPMEIADGGHFLQEWGEPIAKAALETFGL